MFRVGTIPGISGVGECVPAGVGWLSAFVLFSDSGAGLVMLMPNYVPISSPLH